MSILNRLKTIFFKKEASRKEKLPLSVIFSRFRKVIDSNTKALEVIADMGDKLSGDYIFDMAYIRQVHKRLSEHVYQSIHSLNLLSQNRYQVLYDIYENINKKIEVLVSENPVQGPAIKFLDDISPEDLDLVGGKMAHLAELKKHLNLMVPEGFVVTSVGYMEFLRHNRLEDMIRGLEKVMKSGKEDDVESLRAELESCILKGDFSPRLKSSLEHALVRYKEMCGNSPLVVRSSAQEEDQDLSFAGQFETIINVRPDITDLSEAYKRVVASLFGKKAISYMLKFNVNISEMAMAVGCLKLIESRSSGVMFTINLHSGEFDSILISSCWGLGVGVVEGKISVDRFVVSKDYPNRIIERDVAIKERFFGIDAEGIKEFEVKSSQKTEPSLNDREVTSLAKIGISLERYFKKPQDVEWTVDMAGKIYILQSRPLMIPKYPAGFSPVSKLRKRYRVISEKKGRVAQGGIAYGPVFLFRSLEDLDRFPEGAVLVAPRDSSHFVRVMPKASAILTNVGSPTSHMATLCREFRIPAIVGMQDITSRVKEGEIITVDADDNCVYQGRVDELLKFQATSQLDLMETKEFRLLKKILQLVSPLNLVDPLVEDFSPRSCKTFHDLLRFCHEMAVQELINLGKEGNTLLDKSITKRLELKIPTGILVIDLGGGLKPESLHKDRVGFEDIECIPFRSVLEGMLEPGVWQTQAIQMRFKDLISSMLRTPELTPRYVGENIAVISTYYLNLSLRFGYHFNIIDIYCSPNVRENHIYFRFIGGAADFFKRTRRIKLIEKILSYYEFNVVTKGDLLVARLANILLEEVDRLLKMIGRLIGFTRQLDVLMDSDLHVEEAFKRFIKGKFEQ